MGKIQDNATRLIREHYEGDMHLIEPQENIKRLVAGVAEYAYCCSYNTKNRKLFVEELKKAVDTLVEEETA